MSKQQVLQVKHRLEEKIRARLAKEELVLERCQAAIEHARLVAEQKESRLTTIRVMSRNSILTSGQRRQSLVQTPVNDGVAGPSPGPHQQLSAAIIDATMSESAYQLALLQQPQPQPQQVQPQVLTTQRRNSVSKTASTPVLQRTHTSGGGGHKSASPGPTSAAVLFGVAGFTPSTMGMTPGRSTTPGLPDPMTLSVDNKSPYTVAFLKAKAGGKGGVGTTGLSTTSNRGGTTYYQ
jgi:hypothetical protein